MTQQTMASNTDFEFIQRRRQGKLIPKKSPLSIEVKKSITWLFFTLIFLTVILSIVYLQNTTQSSQKGYALQQQQFKQDQLEMMNRELIDKITKAISLNRIEDNPIVQGMLKAENPLYIKEK